MATPTDPASASIRSTDREIEALIERIRRRDAAAMAELFDLFSRRAFGLAYRILGDGSEAEDVVQDTFLSLWRYADRVDPARGRLTAFLLTVTHRRAIDVLRARRQREKRLAPFEPPLDAPWFLLATL